MKALVTGSAGFVGRHMAAALHSRGYEVDGCDLVHGEDARNLFRSSATVYDLVVHCAFHVGGRAAIDRQPRLLARNLELDAAMFNWAVETGQRRVVYFSSSSAYPIRLQQVGNLRLRETDIDLDVVEQPDGRYGWAKLSGEQLARAASQSGLPVHVLRPFSGYGTDQDETYPFRAFVERAKRREDPFTIWGPGTQVRDWIHIDDVTAGTLAVLDADVRQPVNLCTGIGTSMLDVVQLVCDTVGYRPQYAPKPDAPTGVNHRVGDPGLLFTIYEPKITVGEGVRRAL